MERETPVRTYLIEYICDECGVGTMESMGITLTSNPPKYPHQCLNCGHTQMFVDILYPHYRNKEEGS